MDGSVFLIGFLESVCASNQIVGLEIIQVDDRAGNPFFSWRLAGFGGMISHLDVWHFPVTETKKSLRFRTWHHPGQDLAAWHQLLALWAQAILRAGTMTPSANAGLDCCPSISSILPLLQRYASSDALVCIIGEAGTGKTYLAKLLHRLSGRPHEPLFINLSALPDSLLEVELFGHAAGAFTDGVGQRSGKLADADGGTVVFENIESLNEHAQSILCAVLRDHSYYPLAASEPVRFGARVIVTSRIPLDDLRGTGRISDEFYFLVNVLPLLLAPLRERRDDIIHFVDSYLSEVSDKWRIAYRYDSGFLEEMLTRSWNGNIHELMNSLELYRVNGKGGVITAHSAEGVMATQKDLKESINLYKRKLIHDIVLRCGGNQTKAAQILGIQRTYLSRLIKELSLYENSGEGNGKSSEGWHS
jgi:Nif-specific regulatory protein